MPEDIVELTAKIERAQEKLEDVRKFNHPIFRECWELILAELETRMDTAVISKDDDARIIGEIRAIRLLRLLPGAILGDAERSLGARIKDYESRKSQIQENAEP